MSLTTDEIYDYMQYCGLYKDEKQRDIYIRPLHRMFINPINDQKCLVLQDLLYRYPISNHVSNKSSRRLRSRLRQTASRSNLGFDPRVSRVKESFGGDVNETRTYTLFILLITLFVIYVIIYYNKLTQ